MAGEGQDPPKPDPQADPPADPPQDPPAPPADPPPADPPADPPPADPDTFSREYVEGLRREAAERRTTANQLKTQLDSVSKQLDELKGGVGTQFEEQIKGLTDAQAKLEADLRITEERLKYARIESAVVKEAVGLKIVDPEAAYKLLDHKDLTYDDDGLPTNAKDALEALVATKPYLVGQGGSPPPNSGGPTNPQSPKTPVITRESLKQMSPDEINANWETISGALKEGKL